MIDTGRVEDPSRRREEAEKGSCNAMQRKRLSKKERRADALALGAEERRDKLRKAVGRSKCPGIHGFLNGETHMDGLHVSAGE